MGNTTTTSTSAASTVTSAPTNLGPDGKPIQRTFDVKALGTLAEAAFEKEDTYGGVGALAKSFFPKGGKKSQEIDIVKEYPWTLSPINEPEEVPYIRLREYRQTQAVFAAQLAFFGNVARNKSDSDKPATEVLSIYDEIFPRTFKTPWTYKFPYFNDSSFALDTPPWQRLDEVGPAIKGAADAVADAVGSVWKGAGEALSKGIDVATKLAGAYDSAMDVKLKNMYPAVGISDRPKVFTSHNERQITVEFPLFNTIKEWDWTKNRDFIYLFMSQNLYNKRDFVTGVPPVFYDVEIPGQYFCVASNVTNFNVKNLGNTRMIDGYIVPDAWQVSITLTELAMPSKNQFEYIMSKGSKVSTS